MMKVVCEIIVDGLYEGILRMCLLKYNGWKMEMKILRNLRILNIELGLI